MSPAFNNGDCTETSSCTVQTCSCTARFGYFSSSTRTHSPGDAWAVSFNDQGALVNVTSFTAFKITAGHVRAVRGGSNLGSSQ